ncbi:unnamed protein product [Chrysoparadoxa australica]
MLWCTLRLGVTRRPIATFRRPFCQSQAFPKSQESAEEEVLFTSILSEPIRTLKRVSITSCGMSLCMPIALLASSSSVPLSGQIAISATTIAVAVSTTGLLHFFTSNLIHR